MLHIAFTTEHSVLPCRLQCSQTPNVLPVTDQRDYLLLLYSWRVMGPDRVARCLLGIWAVAARKEEERQQAELELGNRHLTEVCIVPFQPQTPSLPEGLLRVGKVCVSPSLHRLLVRSLLFSILSLLLSLL